MLLCWRAEALSSDEVVPFLLEQNPDVALVLMQRSPLPMALPWEGVHVWQRETHQLVWLQRQPLAAPVTELNPDYSIGEQLPGMTYGALSGSLPLGSTSVQVLFVALKDKAFHPLGQSEMRRNEARLMQQEVRKLLREDPGRPLLLCGALNDDADAAGVRGFTESDSLKLLDLRPSDAAGAAWTAHDPESDTWFRYDYALVTPKARQHVAASSLLVERPQPSHRPLLLELSPSP